MAPNQISLSFRDNPDLQQVFAGKHPGEKCKLDITAQIDSMDEDGMTGTIEELKADEGYGANSAGSGDSEEDNSEVSPALVVVHGMGKERG